MGACVRACILVECLLCCVCLLTLEVKKECTEKKEERRRCRSRRPVKKRKKKACRRNAQKMRVETGTARMRCACGACLEDDDVVVGEVVLAKLCDARALPV